MSFETHSLFDLRSFLREGDELELLTTYKGLPFISKARVIELAKNKLSLACKSPSILSIFNKQQAKVLGTEGHPPFACQLDNGDLNNGILELSAIPAEESNLGERLLLRVEPKGELPVSVTLEGQTISGVLADISMKGAGVNLKLSAYQPVLRPGTTVEIFANLPQGSLKYRGMIISVARNYEHSRLAIRFNKALCRKEILFDYIRKRRKEIEHELLDEYQATLLWSQISKPPIRSI